MNSFNDTARIIRIAFAITVIALLAHALGLTPNNGDINFLRNANTDGFYSQLGFNLFSCLIPYFIMKRHWKERAAVLLAGLITAVIFWFAHPDSWHLEFWSLSNAFHSFIGLGIFSVIAILIDKNEDRKNQNRQIINLLIFMMAFQFSVLSLLDLTIALHPKAWDPVVFLIDSSLGFKPSILVAQQVAGIPVLKSVLEFVYAWSPMAILFLCGLQLRNKSMAPANILLIWAVSTIAGLLAYHLCPVAGPGHFFGPIVFPDHVPAINTISPYLNFVQPSYRNGLPSMHFGMALMALFTARYQQSRLISVSFFIIAVLVMLSTLSTGEHYLIDLVVSFPFVVAIQSYCTHVDTAGQKLRMQAIIAGIGMWLMWVLLVRSGLTVFLNLPGFTWVVAALTVTASLLVYRRIWPHEVWSSTTEPVRSALPIVRSELGLNVTVMFYISGFTGLMYEVIFSKELALAFGGMATSTYTVLTVYMGGMATGSWLGGMLISRTRRSGLAIYAACEFMIGIYCLMTPFLFTQIRNLYVVLAAGIAPDATSLIILRIVCGSLVLLVPTILMGMTLPVMVSELQRKNTGIGQAISKLYGANTLGAATGALLSGYFILPFLGVFKSIALSAAGSLLVAFFALRLDKQLEPAPHSGQTTPHDTETNFPAVSPMIARMCFLSLFITGCVTMLIEVNYMQLLGVVAGNSVYAFSLMLFSLLMGLGAGALVAKSVLAKKLPTPLILTLLLLALAGVLLAGAFQWNSLPASFAAYGLSTVQLNFSARESIRAITCWLMMFPPAVLIGACYPIALELALGARQPENRSRLLGGAIGFNTLGNIAGTLLGGFLLIPALGMLKTIWISAALCLLSGLLITAAARLFKNAAVLTAAALVMILFSIQPAGFNYTLLASGSNVYFAYRDNGTVIDHAESLDGGLTAVSTKDDKQNGVIKTLLTNGKFQGNNALRGEMPAQLSFAVTPLLHTLARDNALVIGYGTGVSARAVKEAGFLQLDIVDLSRDLVTLANRHFGNINKNTSTQPGVTTFITDGRNFLLLQNKKYDLISMEITSIWFAGAASLYNQEFYELASGRLTEHGVLQQWIQIHHLSPVDLASILSTARTVFPIVNLYVIGGQGILIAEKTPDNIPPETAISLMRAKPGLMDMFNEVNLDPSNLRDGLILSSDDTNRLIKSFANSSDFVVSTDDNLFLEYSTPKGNAMDPVKSSNQLMGFLQHFSSQQRGAVRPTAP